MYESAVKNDQNDIA